VTLSLPKTYQAQSQITFNLPLVNSSRFGEYTFSSQKVSDYLTLLYSDEVKNEVVEVTQIASSNFKIQVDLDNESTIALIKTTSNNPDIAKKVNDVLIDTYIMKLRLQYKIDAIDRFIYIHENNIKNRNFEIVKIESMINQLELFLNEINPVYTLRKAIFSDSEAAALYAENNILDHNAFSNSVIFEENLNEKYLEIVSNIIDLKLDIIDINEEIKFSNKLLIDLNAEKNKINNKSISNYDLMLNDELDILNGAIIQVNKATKPIRSILPKNIMNIFLGFSIGLTISVLYSLFKYYWKTQL